LTDICEGEELCADYGESYWKSMRSIVQHEAMNRRLLMPMVKSYATIAEQLAAAGQQLTECTLKAVKDIQSWEGGKARPVPAPSTSQGAPSTSRRSMRNRACSGKVEAAHDPARTAKTSAREVRNLTEQARRCINRVPLESVEITPVSQQRS
jgi:hypothetical protein